MMTTQVSRATILALAIAFAGQSACLPAYDPEETTLTPGNSPGVNCDSPAPEICDGVDNDCDGQIDEDFPRRGISCGNNIGVCSGITICEDGQEICFATQAPEDEACDGLDNDCDGQIDELTEDDPDNCGACGNICTVDNGGAGCRLGQCVVESCSEGFLDCDRDPANGCETDITSDPTNCGACANICSAEFAESVCMAGDCIINQCLGGREDCNNAPIDGCEADTTIDTLNCGGCGFRCEFDNAQASCQEMLCAFDACLNGFGDRDEDPANGCEVGLQLLSSPPDSQLDNLTRSENMLFGSANESLFGYPLMGDGTIGALAFTHVSRDAIIQLDSEGTDVYAALSQGDIQILDTSDPDNVSPVGLVTTSGPSPGFARDGDILYVADGRDGLRVVNIASPSEPVQIARAPTRNIVQRAFLSGERLILNAAGRNEFDLFDVSDPQDPQLTGTFNVQTPFDQAVLSGDLLITGSVGASAIQLYRQDAEQLTFLGQANLPGGLVAIEQRFPFLLAVVQGPNSKVNLVLVDIRRPQQPAIANTFEAAVPNSPRSATVDGEQIIIAGSSGLQRFNISDLRRPDSLQDIVRPQDLRDVALAGERLFIAANGAVEILDNSDPQAPVRIARLGEDFRNILPAGTRFYVTSDAQGIVGYSLNDINDDTPPFIIIEGPRPTNLAIDSTGNILYALRGSTLETINTQGDINSRGTLDLPASCRDIVRHQNILYLACSEGVIAIDPQSPPTSPVIIAQPGGGNLFDLTLFGQTLYAVTDSSIVVYTALSPGNISLVNTVELGTTGLRRVEGGGPWIVVGSGNELRLVDRSNLTNVVPVALRTLEGSIVDTAATPSTFYAGTSQGVFRLSVEAP